MTDSEDPDLPDILSVARVVVSTPKSPGETGLCKQLRDLYKKEPLRFLTWHKSLEKDWQDYKVNRLKAQQGKGKGPDEGTEKAVELVEKLIRELTAK